MAVPATSSIVSYGGAATSMFHPTPTAFAQLNYGSNYISDKIKYCAPYQVAAIKKRLKTEQSYSFWSTSSRSIDARRGALYCRSGTWLEIHPTRYDNSVHVRGTQRNNSKYSILEFISVAIGLISMRAVETKHFVCMDPSGKLYATPSSNYSTECVFHEEMMENYYNLYSSCIYGSRSNPWYIEIRRSGKPRRGPTTRKRRKASHFLVMHYDINRLLTPSRPHGDDVTGLVVASLYHQPPSHPAFQRISTSESPKKHVHRISSLRARVEPVNDDEHARQKEHEERKRRREKKKRRREERLMREEQRRRERQEELNKLRAEELRRSRYNRLYYSGHYNRQPTTARPTQSPSRYAPRSPIYHPHHSIAHHSRSSIRH